MALQSNALTTVDNFLTYRGQGLNPRDMLMITNDTDGGATTSATIEVTSSLIRCTTNVTANTVTLASYTSITLLAAAINALGEGWVATVELGAGSGTPADLEVAASQNSLSTTIFLSGVDRGAVEQAINAASDAIEAATGRRFASQTYSQRYTGKGLKNLTLRHRPVTAVGRVAIGRVAVINVTNSSTDAAQATVSVTDVAVFFNVVGGVNDSTQNASFATNTTMTAMVAAINALGNGWTANLVGSVAGTWATLDLLQFSPRNALNIGNELHVPAENVAEYDVQGDVGRLTLRGPRGGYGRLDYGSSTGGLGHGGPIYPLTAEKIPPFWPVGMHNIFVSYTAGYATVPADVVQVCHELAGNYLSMAMRETGLGSESVAGHSYSSGDGPMTAAMTKTLNRKRDFIANMDFVDV